MTRIVRVRWSEPELFSDFEKKPDKRYEVLYAACTQSTILCFGEAYKKPEEKDLTQNQKLHQIAREVSYDNMYVSLGELQMEPGRRISRQLVEDVWDLLVWFYTPPKNTRACYGYCGRRLCIYSYRANTAFHRLICSP
ncbi:MAG: hypothetical protein ACTSVD_01915 [Candidatus Thorarchaeota archaeon]|nr:MAG: hypothetical protein DRO93_10660 [Candidatus Thorarchaeota archaeon]